jgi:hypothetical protein
MSRIDSGSARVWRAGKDARFQVSSDDATLVEFVADKARQALDDFMTWETAPPSG